jgi:hypothetical protein
MNKIEFLDQQIIIHISGWDKFFALKGTVSFPQTSITHVDAYNKSITPPWLKNPGTAIPGVIIAGSYQNLSGRKEFWCTHFQGNTIVIDLEHEQYNRIVVDLPADQPVNEWIDRLRNRNPTLTPSVPYIGSTNG